ncbi:unnamed protein product [Blepharisma stoltei]|uniref:LITAF domain-containing protein n=1 Tax=Blepharisma stoltei TaxID=1481888 RepID=A0AAU9IVL0_9CILI|nr:unnamed protein product [Blepharisma stoltei]
MGKSEDKEQSESSISVNPDNSGPPPNNNPGYTYPVGAPIAEYPYVANGNQNYPPQADPSCYPNQQLAPMYIGSAVVVDQPPMQAQNIPIQFGRKPVTMVCPQCHEMMNTVIKRRPGLFVFLLVVLLVVVFWPAFFVPFFFICWYDVYHNCGKCKMSLGSKKILGG